MGWCARDLNTPFKFVEPSGPLSHVTESPEIFSLWRRVQAYPHILEAVIDTCLVFLPDTWQKLLFHFLHSLSQLIVSQWTE